MIVPISVEEKVVVAEEKPKTKKATAKSKVISQIPTIEKVVKDKVVKPKSDKIKQFKE